MSEFFTWVTLATFGGASIGTAIITQFIKEWSFINRIPTQILSYFIALIILLGANYAIGAISGWAEFGIIPLNAILVSLAANGEFAAVKRLFRPIK